MGKQKIERLKLDKIRIDGGTQPRKSIDQATVEDYAEKLDELPPVDVYFDGTDNWLADGFHRLYSHRAKGKATIKAIVHKGTQRDAIIHSVGANTKHGLRRSNEDKRKSVQTLLDDAEWSKRSSRWIAETCGVSHDLVLSMKDSTGGNASSNTKVESKDGKERPAAKPAPVVTSDVSCFDDDPPPPKPEHVVPVTPKHSPTPTPPPIRLDKQPQDEEGGMIPKDLLPVFEGRERLDAVVSLISQAKCEVEAAIKEGDPAFGAVNWSAVEAMANNFYQAIKQARPHAVCPYHANDPLMRKDCRACKGAGWVTKLMFTSAPKDFRKGRKSA